MEKMKAILLISIFLAFFLCLSVPAVYAQSNQEGNYAQVNNVNLNGQGDYLVVEPGELVDVQVFYEFRCMCILSEYTDEIVIGLEDEPLGCLIDGFCGSECDNTDVFYRQKIYDILAPTEPGIYYVMYINEKGFSCSEVKELYLKYPQSRKTIGTIEVKGSDSDEWKLIDAYDFTIKSSIEQTREYSLEFYQRMNDLRVEIHTPGLPGVEGGSVSVSVNEDVFVDYNSGGSFKRVSEDKYTKIEHEQIDPITAAYINWLLAAVPHSGIVTGFIGVHDAVESERGFLIYHESDMTGAFKDTSSVFTDRKYLNNRDVVVVPWRLEIGYLAYPSVRVDLPHLEFPEKGVHNVVYRVNCKIHNSKVCHYVALPIQIGKQRMEA